MYTHVTRDSPPWIDEGLAEYFEHAVDEWGHFSPEILPGSHIATLRKALKSRTLLLLDDLLTMKRARWNDSLFHRASGRIQYAQSWSVVYFLLHGDPWERRDYLDRYFKAIIEKKTGSDALKQVFGRDSAAFEKNWLAYVRHLVSR